MKTPHMLQLAREAVREAAPGRSARVLANQARKRGDLVQAAELYGRVPKTDRNYKAAMVQRGNLLKDMARFEPAKAAYLAAMKVEPDDADVALQLGHLHKLAGRLDEALHWYTTANRLDPDDAKAKRELETFDTFSGENRSLFDICQAVDAEGSADVMTRAVKGAVDEGFLDLGFYRQRYFSAKSDAEIHDEFLRCGSFNGRSYSDKIESIEYIMSNRDLDSDAMLPSEHYRLTGREDKRRTDAAYRNFSSVGSARLKMDEDTTFVGDVPKIGIHLHVYYGDYIARFRKFLSRFPYPFTLFVSKAASVTDAQINLLSSLPNLKAMIVKPAVNKGRNFGPMLVDFRREILEMDYCCHLHSKKSLHSGVEQVGWASYQIEHLVGDPYLVQMHLQTLEQDKALNLLAPVPFWKAPYWASHWLQNQDAGRTLLQRFGLSSSDGFLTYPVGGMFWFRVDGLRKLLETEWSYDDFPEELAQIDGTIQHALERAVAVFARQNNGKVLFYEPWTNAYGLDEYDMFAEYRKHGPSVILNAAREHAVVSFDVFDTVIYRQSLDKEVGKRGVAEYLEAAGDHEAAAEFLVRRNGREFDLRQKMSFAGDVTLAEIYAEMALHGDLAGHDPDLLLAVEFETDLADQMPRLAVVQIINALIERGARVVFVSDSYYSASQIRQMLNQAGVAQLCPVFVSSEVRQRKDTGRIWAQLADELGVSLRDIFHIGDNVVSDVQKVGDLGIRNRLVLSLIDKASYLMERDLNDASEFERAVKEGLKPVIIAAGKSPFFVH